MSQEERRDGPYYIDQMVVALGQLHEGMPGLSPPLSTEAGHRAAERMQRLAAMLAPIRKKLFVKTQGGSEMARQCAEQVAALKSVVVELSGQGAEAGVARLEEALSATEARIEPFVDKTQNLVIRMT